jgi:hypothetical protein
VHRWRRVCALGVECASTAPQDIECASLASSVRPWRRVCIDGAPGHRVCIVGVECAPRAQKPPNGRHPRTLKTTDAHSIYVQSARPSIDGAALGRRVCIVGVEYASLASLDVECASRTSSVHRWRQVCIVGVLGRRVCVQDIECAPLASSVHRRRPRTSTVHHWRRVCAQGVKTAKRPPPTHTENPQRTLDARASNAARTRRTMSAGRSS